MMAQRLKHLPAVRETWVWSLGLEDPLEKEMATHSSILDWRIPWTEEPGGYSPWGRKESDTTEWLHSLTLYTYRSSLYVQGAYAYTHRISAVQDEMSSRDWSLNYLNVHKTLLKYTLKMTKVIILCCCNLKIIINTF